MKQVPKAAPEASPSFLRRNAWRILGLAFVILLVHDVFGAHGFIAMRRTQRDITQMRQEIGKMNDQNKSLSNQVQSLKTDPKAIERIAREEMGLARPGERIYRLPDSFKPGDPQSQVPQK